VTQAAKIIAATPESQRGLKIPVKQRATWVAVALEPPVRQVLPKRREQSMKQALPLQAPQPEQKPWEQPWSRAFLLQPALCRRAWEPVSDGRTDPPLQAVRRQR